VCVHTQSIRVIVTFIPKKQKSHFTVTVIPNNFSPFFPFCFVRSYHFTHSHSFIQEEEDVINVYDEEEEEEKEPDSCVCVFKDFEKEGKKV